MATGHKKSKGVGLTSRSNRQVAGGEGASTDLVHQQVSAIRFGAPSAYDRQPWRIEEAFGRIQIFAERSKSLSGIDPRGRELIMSCGAVLRHVRTRIAQLGRTPVVKKFPDLSVPDLVASVEAKDGLPRPRNAVPEASRDDQRPDNELSTLASPDAMPGLARVVEQEGAIASTFEDAAAIAEIADSIARSERIQLSDPAVVDEIAYWTGGGERSKASTAERYLLRIARSAEKTRECPLLMLISTRFDTAPAWLSAGQATANLLSTAQAVGLTVAHPALPVMSDRLRSQMAKRVDGPVHPQIIFGIRNQHVV